MDDEKQDGARLNELIAELWGQIIVSVNHVLKADQYFGFTQFMEFADPSIDQILNSIQLVDPVLVAALNSEHIKGDPERNLWLLNCQMAVHLIRRTHVSLKNGDETEYLDCIQKLRSQRQH